MTLKLSLFKNIIICSILGLLSLPTSAQIGNGRLSGDLMSNLNFYQRDTSIEADGTPLYNNFLNGGESWFGVRYATNDFAVNVRFDGFYNSILFNPQSYLNDQGIGMWSIEKSLEKVNLDLKVGYIYTQIGSGLLFRSYEDRGLLIDNALVGFSSDWRANDHLRIKAMMGKQKFLFSQFDPTIKAISADMDFDIGSAHISPGIAGLNRTLDYNTMNQLTAEINALEVEDRFVPKYNMYAGTFYNTLTVGRFNWYFEAAFKSEEAIRDLNGELYNAPGNTIFTTLGITGNGWGINGTYKRVQDFVMRTDPMALYPNAGWLNWQPVVAQIRPQRLLSRYTPPALSDSEEAYAIDAFWGSEDGEWSINAAYTHINTLADSNLYREFYSEIINRSLKRWIFTLGTQILGYNQAVYQLKPPSEYPYFRANSLFSEVVYKIDKKHSVRGEFQLMSAFEDFGSWLYILLEYNVAPHWSVSIADMYNYDPNYSHVNQASHYPNIFLGYTYKSTRFTAQWVKQVQGINCTGGVCRYEPAFSGYKFGLTTTF